MMRLIYRIALVCLAAALCACSVMSSQLREQVDQTIAYQDLVQNPAASIGRKVIFGGYVLEVTNLTDKTILMLLQAPLGFQDEPGSRDKSGGRLIVEYPGFLDPAIYAEDRKVTVGGRVLDGGPGGNDAAPYPFLRVAAAELHLWPQPAPEPPYDPWWYGPPYYRYHHHHWRHPHHWYGPW